VPTTMSFIYKLDVYVQFTLAKPFGETSVIATMDLLTLVTLGDATQNPISVALHNVARASKATVIDIFIKKLGFIGFLI
jgi:hypothetical protein